MIEFIPILIDAEITDDSITLDCDISVSEMVLEADIGVAYVMSVLPIYDGPAVIIPTEDDQIIATEGKHVLSNITVEKIPSNYGRVTWNGSYLTIS